ncbi:MAG TPA: glucose-6-phosphate dehydrogenase [Clostridia bacterium]|nr:glucose-6-phosphate dehydrogenase [Clostridia bacterium]
MATIQTSPREKLPSVQLPPGDSVVLVVFGATGDLTRRKLVPALFDLACIGCTHKRFDVIGTARSERTTEEFRRDLREAVASSKDARDYSESRWRDFENRLEYMTGDPGDVDFYPKLAARLEEKRLAGASPNHLFYLSTPASLAPAIIAGLGAAGLSNNPHGWARIVIEKPFGHDLNSARELNRIVGEYFDEKSVYRIDHYLGKETVQNILVFRFGNSMFEPVWNRNYIDYVEITAAETLGVENRAGFYEETGALRDMVANHLLQLVALTAMEPPVAFEADAVREEKVKVFRSMRPMSVEEVAKRTVRGQYGPGEVDGTLMRGYREEPGVKPGSTIETFAAVEFYIDNWRWAGVPFYVRSGKRLARNVTEIVLHFKRTPHTLFSRAPQKPPIEPNSIIMRIQPNEGIAINFGAKRPGAQMQATTVQMDFSYREAFGLRTPVAYETLLLDAMRGDATLFTRGDEVEAEWRIITPIEDAWRELPPPRFPNYAAGSDGPDAAQELIADDGRGWRPIQQNGIPM